MFMDTLGIIIGFITIVLLLSILVTAIVQTLTSVLRVRHRTLRLGLQESDVEGALQTAISSPTARDGASANDALFKRIQQTLQDARSAQDPRVTWLEDKQVIEPLKAAGVAETGIVLVQYALDTARRKAEDKLLQWSRGMSFALSVIVAFLFAASVPDLLERLSSDADFRARVEALGERMVHETPPEYSSLLLGTPGLRARTAFLEKYPQYTVPLGALRFEAVAVDDLVANFETAMDAEPERDELAMEFRALVEQELEEQNNQAVEAARRAVTDLAGLGIAPIGDLSFYFTKDKAGENRVHGDRIVGVLFMAVLLSFGAAFWYRALKELVGLKDALRKRNDKPETDAKTVPGD